MRMVLKVLLGFSLVLSCLPVWAGADWATPNQNDQVWHISLSKDGRLLVVCSVSYLGYWDLQEGTYRHLASYPYRDQEGDVFDLAYAHAAFSDDNRWLAIITDTLQVYDLKQQTHHALGNAAGMKVLAFAPDGTLITAGKQVQLWDVQSGASPGTLSGDMGDATALGFSPNGSLLAVNFETKKTGHLSFWAWPSRKPLYRHRFETVRDLWFCADEGPFFQSAKGLFALELATRSVRPILLKPYALGVDPSGTRMAFHGPYQKRKPSDKPAAAGGYYARLFLADVGDIQNADSVPELDSAPLKVVFHPGGRFLFVLTESRALYLLDHDGRPLAALFGADGCGSVKTPDGQVAWGSDCSTEDKRREVPLFKQLFRPTD